MTEKKAPKKQEKQEASDKPKKQCTVFDTKDKTPEEVA
jgi:hypothetical protein